MKFGNFFFNRNEKRNLFICKRILEKISIFYTENKKKFEREKKEEK